MYKYRFRYIVQIYYFSLFFSSLGLGQIVFFSAVRILLVIRIFIISCQNMFLLSLNILKFLLLFFFLVYFEQCYTYAYTQCTLHIYKHLVHTKYTNRSVSSRLKGHFGDQSHGLILIVPGQNNRKLKFSLSIC